MAIQIEAREPHLRRLEPPPGFDLRRAIADRTVTQVEVGFTDHLGALRGKRIPARSYLGRADRGFAFCDAALTWDFGSVVHDDFSISGSATGYPDMIARPDEGSARGLPWRDGAALVLADVHDPHGRRIGSAPRSVLHRAVERLAALGYEAEVGLELEFHLLDGDGGPLAGFSQCYSLERLNDLDPAFDALLRGLEHVADVEGGNAEYGAGQCEVNLAHRPPVEAADQAVRLKYAVRELARRAGATATFMAKPFGGESGNSMHVHVSLWRDGAPAFAPDAGGENDLMRSAIAGLVGHLPGLTLYAAPTVNSYRRFEVDSFAPTTASWGGDNRTGSVRSLAEGASASRIELRTGGADANPYWLTAGVLAAIAIGIEDAAVPTGRGEGNLYERGVSLPRSLERAAHEALVDGRLTEILGSDAVSDYGRLALAEWRAFLGTVTEWERERYLKTV